MGQEFHVVRCYSCEVFQSCQVRKDAKFVCRACGAKQSVRKEYGRGSGKDCRVHVQKLNSLRGSLHSQAEDKLERRLQNRLQAEDAEEQAYGGTDQEAYYDPDWEDYQHHEGETYYADGEDYHRSKSYEHEVDAYRYPDDASYQSEGNVLNPHCTRQPTQGGSGGQYSKWSAYLDDGCDDEQESHHSSLNEPGPSRKKSLPAQDHSTKLRTSQDSSQSRKPIGFTKSSMLQPITQQWEDYAEPNAYEYRPIQDENTIINGRNRPNTKALSNTGSVHCDQLSHTRRPFKENNNSQPSYSVKEDTRVPLKQHTREHNTTMKQEHTLSTVQDSIVPTPTNDHNMPNVQLTESRPQSARSPAQQSSKRSADSKDPPRKRFRPTFKCSGGQSTHKNSMYEKYEAIGEIDDVFDLNI